MNHPFSTVTIPQGHDVVRDFEVGVDSIDYGIAVIQLKEVFDVDADGDLDTFISFGANSTLTLLDVGNVVSIGGPQSVPEGHTAVFEVLRSGDTTSPLTIDYTITGSVTRTGSITFAASSARETITVASFDNTVDEADRYYTVTIQDPGKDTVVIGNPVAAGAILDNDPTPRPRGDPHMITLDGLAYDFQAVGEFVLVENAAGEDLSVQMRTRPVGDLASLISALAVDVDGHRVTINTEAADVLRVDGVVTEVADGATLAVGAGQVQRSGDTYTLTTASGDLISAEDFGGHLDLALILANGRAPGSVRGLLGNFNQNTADDLALPDGTAFAQPIAFADLYGVFADAWRVTHASSLFDYAAGESTETFTDRTFPSHPVMLDMLAPAVVAEATRRVDAAGITDPVLREAAILDFALTHDPDFVIGATKVVDPSAALEVIAEPSATQSVLAVVSRVGRQAEGNSGSTDLVFDIHRSGNTSGELSVSYRVVGGSVDAGDLGGALPAGVVTFGDGETLKSVAVPVAGDTQIESDESLLLEISVDDSVRDRVAFATVSAQATIANDDGTVLPRFEIEAVSAIKAEGADGETTELVFRVLRTENLSDAVTIDYEVSGLGGDPVEADDFMGGALPAGTLVFGRDEGEQTLRMRVSGDDLLERNERFVVTLRNPSLGVVGEATAFGMIENDDAFVARHSILPINASRSEGNEGTAEFSFVVVRSGNVDAATSVDFVVAPTGSSSVDAADFGGTLPMGSLTFAAGEVEKRVSIQVAGDIDHEADESFAVALHNPSSGLVGGDPVTATIVNDDAPLPSIGIWRIGANLAEGDTGTTEMPFAVVRTGDLGVRSIVGYAVAGSGANPAAASDFAGGLPAGSVTFEPGEDFKVLAFDIAGDALLEVDEGFSVVLSDAVRAVIGTGSAEGLIVNDDSSAAPELSIAAAGANKPEGSAGTVQILFTVTRTGDLSQASAVAYSVTGSGAHPADATDFGGVLPAGSISFAAGEHEKQIAIEVSGDGTVEKNESFTVGLHDADNGTIAAASAAGIILNDDTSSFRIGDAPARPPRSDAGAWERSWTHSGVSIAHKANLGDSSEPFTPVLFGSSGSGVLAGGDISAGDLGVSGQTKATSSVLQEIDGTEGLRFVLDEEANEITFLLSRFLSNDDGTVLNEAGRVQLLDAGGALVNELFFYADRADGTKQVSLAAPEGFTQAVFSAGVQDGDEFVYGGYANQDRSGFGSSPFAASGSLHGSDYLIDLVAFKSGYVDML